MARTTSHGLLLAFLLESCSVLGAHSQTHVSVDTKLEARRFRLQFASQLGDVEQQVAMRFRHLLSQEVGFLRFSVHDTSASYRILFVLDRRERNSNALFPEFGFWVRLLLPDSTQAELYWLTFRSADQASAAVGKPQDFLGELEEKLSSSDLGPLRDSLLAKIPITEQALVVSSPLGWAITFPRLDLCIKNMSQLNVLSDFNVNGMALSKLARARVVGDFETTIPPTPNVQPFLGGTFSEPATQAEADDLTRQLGVGPITVKEIYVTSYIHDPNACRDRGREDGP